MIRRSRRWFSVALVFGLLFAQCITVAHACPVAGLASSTAPLEQAGMPADCPDMAGGVSDTRAGCAAHCVADQQADTQLPIAAPAASDIAPLAVRMQADPPAVRVVVYTQRASSHSPPPLLLFSRLLV